MKSVQGVKATLAGLLVFGRTSFWADQDEGELRGGQTLADHVQEWLSKRDAIMVEKHVLRREVLLQFGVNAANHAFAVGPAVGDEDHRRSFHEITDAESTSQAMWFSTLPFG